ncbi:PTS mannitol transporter subunit IICB [Spiroplasma turonicum]|uniref:PTS system mannitol-specific IIBC component n=1 Tax=Spiroplasma turonicum TaxID=216946 RepID=A0A0K1P6T8_9MOLU|nr:PTS mannitol transporter subunit IICB [Spiroplasma turonicum]AKU80021.1 PTS system mannitol-specific IIBC component [Spiroplasma turonicum]ALX71023.1 PTS system, mannitol-specific IIC component [Spiroplasma turonicum]
MDEIIKEINNRETNNKFALFMKNNFNKRIAMRRVQKFGGWLSSMIMPIIGLMIAWGLLTAFFIEKGWTPVEAIEKYIVGNIITYLIPVLIGFNAGRLVHKDRGGFIATFVVFAVIMGNQYNPGFAEGSSASPQLLSAMIVGPASAGILKGVDKLLEGRVKQGFEMLVNNFVMGFLAFGLGVGAFYGMPYIFNSITWALAEMVRVLITNKLIFLAALIVEPAKIFFLNNAINHGVFTPLSLELTRTYGKSILYLLEANPGPGLGALITFMIFDKKQRGNAAGASIIHFFGGIHEVYFPFILMKIEMIFALIAGGLVGDAIFQIFDAGLIAPASPGSIIAISIFIAPGAMNYAGVFLGIAASCGTTALVGFLIHFIMRKKYKKMSTSYEEAAAKMQDLKGKESKYVKTNKLTDLPKLQDVKKIIFACEAGMGSSAMGASVLRKKLKENNINIEVVNYPVKELPNDAMFVITQEQLSDYAKQKAPNAIHKSISNFLDKSFYDKIILEFKENLEIKNEERTTT